MFGSWSRRVFARSCSLPAVNCSRLFSSKPLFKASKIRNVAIIAHVDHGKTTLVNKLMSQTGMKVTGDRTMDSIALEQERGITIMSKCTRLNYNGHILNVVDTPGHADFGGEVERVLSMVEGVVLVVDAAEGVMPQTKFVLEKALKADLAPIVVINKVDKPSRRVPGGVDNEIFDLFVNLDASEEQMDFPALFCSAKNGWAVIDLEGEENKPNKSLKPLLDAIVDNTPTPKAKYEDQFRMLVTSIEQDDYLGRVVTGKVSGGGIKVGDSIKALSRASEDLQLSGKVTKIMVPSLTEGTKRVSIEEACAGDIVSISGLRAHVTDTICEPAVTTAVPAIPLDPPTISMTFSVNDGPLAGKDGSKLTSTVLKNRLESEIENNVTISIKNIAESEAVEVQGRGELQMGILLEQMRREDYELCVSPPRVLMKTDSKGVVSEPIEEVTIDVDNDYSSTVIDKMQRRGAEMLEFNNDRGDRSRLIFHIPSRLLMGYRSEFQTDTRGNGVLCSAFHGYKKRRDVAATTRKGAIVSVAKGTTTNYALAGLEDRGQLFVGPNTEVYEGMIVGEHARDNDIDVNPTKAKKLSNMRSTGKDDTVRLAPPKEVSIEKALTYIKPDEMVEITPKNVRLRKRFLSIHDRKRASKRSDAHAS